MKKDRSQCAIFWLLSAEAQAALMQAHYDEAGERLKEPPAPDTSNNWETRVSETSDEIGKIMSEKPRGQRRVD